MDNMEKKTVASAATQSQKTPEAQPIDQPKAADPTKAGRENQAPLPTYDAINAKPADKDNASAPVVTPDVIADRLRAAGAKPSAPPLAGRRKADTQRREGDNKDNKDSGKPGRGSRRERSRDVRPVVRGPISNAKVPNRRAALDDDLADEFTALLEGKSFDAVMKKTMDAVDDASSPFEEGDKVVAKYLTTRGDSVFVDIGAREQGIIPLKQFPDDFELTPGASIDAVVTKYNAEDGVYEVSLPLAAAEVGDWLSLSKGMIVEAVVTGANAGGLECSVGKLRGFMPLSQIAPFRVENPEQFTGERWKAVVTEVNPERRNLVISRRVLMEQEREEQREKTMSELAEGQSCEGLVRKIIDAGVFVDLGGVDGFIPISQLGWGRVKHPSDVVKEGERIVVTVTKIDQEKDRITLSFRDAALDPWNSVESNVKVGDILRGTVVSIMSFGAFVDVGNNLEGLVHISEIAYQRVNSVEDVLNVGDVVNVLVLGVDLERRRISLSIKQTMENPRIKAKREEQEKLAEEQDRKDEEAAQASRDRIRKLRPKGPLKGGLGPRDDGGTGLHF
ncbi:MAG: 30S ribosomal protein S1 [Thermoguttaceae bacterium]|jgi:ribosomal protein S1